MARQRPIQQFTVDAKPVEEELYRNCNACTAGPEDFEVFIEIQVRNFHLILCPKCAERLEVALGRL